jgi:hypothetical protein
MKVSEEAGHQRVTELYYSSTAVHGYYHKYALAHFLLVACPSAASTLPPPPPSQGYDEAEEKKTRRLEDGPSWRELLQGPGRGPH